MTNYSASIDTTGLGINHGYCLDGDFVHLNADVSLADADVTGGAAWSLQLWASTDGFADRQPNGVKVAELALPASAGSFNVADCVAALPPAGGAPQVMALALVGQGADGQVTVRDLSVYPTRQIFVQPFLYGAVSCCLLDGLGEIAIDRIASPRPAENLSGTLALEVWALDTPYAGGSWVGTPVASLVLGVLAGGADWHDCQYSVPAVTTNPGAALTVMLREWTPAGYVTRDFRNLPAPAAAVVEAAPPAVVPVAEPAKAKAAKKAVPKTGKQGAAKPLAATTGLVSVNSATAEQLAAVKGLSRSVGAAIVAARPYAKLDDLVRAKGMGPKLLEKVGKLLKL
jgi:hypothetical protein